MQRWLLSLFIGLSIFIPSKSEALSYDDIMSLRLEVKGLSNQVNHHETDFSLLYDRLKDLENAQDYFHDKLKKYEKENSHDSFKLFDYEKEFSRIKEHTSQLNTLILSQGAKLALLEKQLHQDVAYLKHSLETILHHLGAASSASTDNTYTVKPGDTLSSIAIAKKTSTSEIKFLNKLSSDKIFPGQILKIS
ncbi:hypothetical protein CLAVI_000214 [Candidatus Clavichlamydia salmonicola]|uniref:LysM peptidoglycan-binding domain-containing protein n=1 Tax=Candidatus Clavichlamydia salmonicola TaxID=469812 RepID=UPI001E531908|nr:LysM peptidoglycan-binding domain-containing protein [Candidatus Clavichlamydia salmonicola]MBF5050603.1 hypothetical protein [Candidatus Clavichlamydia salmonicola]